MKNIIILTAESKNFVPVEIKKAADQLQIPAQIIDVTKCVLLEGLSGNSPESHKLMSCLYVVETGEDDVKTVRKLEIGPDTVIIPRLNEHHLEIKLGILKRLEKLGCILINTPESMELCNDKLMSQILLNSAGIKTPLSFTVQNLDDIETVVAEFEKQGLLKYPVIVKTLRGTHGIGVMKLDSRSSLVSVGQTLAKEGLDFIIQEFCKHKQSCRIIMLGGTVLAANLRGQPKEKDEFRTNSHLGSETEKYEPGEEEVAMACRIVELFGSRFCAIDYIMLEDGQIMVLEVNGSPGLEAIQKNWPEKNLPEMVAKYAQSGCTSVCADIAKPAATVEPATQQSPEAVQVVQEPAAELEVTPAEPDLSQDALQEIEPCLVHRIMDNPVECRIDTGAKSSGLHVDKYDIIDTEWVKFSRGDITYKVPLSRTVRIKNLHGGESTRRPVVKLDITIKGKRFNQVEFTLVNRSNMKYEVLVGRNILELLGMPVMVFKKEIEGTDAAESEIYSMEEEE
jgi:RimK family alpha-L-glutamate ligase